MKKKLIATLVAGAVLSTGLIGLTACGGGNSITKGKKVDADGWKTAITATAEAESYTVDTHEDTTVKITGSIEEMGITDLEVTTTSKGEGKEYYVANSALYSKTSYTVEVTGVPEGMEDEFKASDYVNEKYTVKDGDTYYKASYYGSSSNPAWSVYTSSEASDSSLSDLFDEELATEKGGEAKKVIDLYDAFTYSSGVYTATLYSEDESEIILSVSVKGGYVVGIAVEYNYEYEDYGMKTTVSAKAVYNISGYGKTEVTPSDDAKKAVDDYKADHN